MMSLMPPQPPDKHNYVYVLHVYLLCMHICDITYIYVHTILRYQTDNYPLRFIHIKKVPNRLIMYVMCTSRFVFVGVWKVHG